MPLLPGEQLTPAGVVDKDGHRAVAASNLVRRFGAADTPLVGPVTSAVRLSGSGDNLVYTPAAGNRLRLLWVGLSTSQNNPLEVLVIVRLGTQVVYRWNLGNPGAFTHWQSVDAANANDALIVNLSAASNPVDVNYTVEEH